MSLKNHPNTFIIGAPKCGTSALSNFMSQHEQVFFSPIKEPLYYGRNASKQTGLCFSEYLKLFKKANPKKHRIIAEATPCILYDVASIKEILSRCPDANFIVLIRNPVDTVISAFIQTKKHKHCDISSNVDEAWATCLSNRRQGFEVCFKYDDHFLYYKHIFNLLEIIDANRLKIILHEDLLVKPLAVLADFFSFLGIHDEFVPKLSIINPRGVLKRGWLIDLSVLIWHKLKKIRHLLGLYNLNFIKNMLMDTSSSSVENFIKISPNTRASIVEHHLSDIIQLEQLIGRDLSHWKNI